MASEPAFQRQAEAVTPFFRVLDSVCLAVVRVGAGIHSGSNADAGGVEVSSNPDSAKSAVHLTHSKGLALFLTYLAYKSRQVGSRCEVKKVNPAGRCAIGAYCWLDQPCKRTGES